MSTKSRLANKTLHLLVAMLILLTSVPVSASPAVAGDEISVSDIAQVDPPIQKVRLGPGIRLYAVCDPAVVELGAQATCTVTVFNEDIEDAAGLELSAYLPEGLSLAGGEHRWKVAIENLAMGESVALELTLDVGDDATGPLSFEIEANDKEGVRAETTAIVGVVGTEAMSITALGGSFDGQDGRIRVHFPPGAVKKESKVKAQVHKQGIDPRGKAKDEEDDKVPGRTGALLRFDLEAEDAATGEEVAYFGMPVTLEVDLRGLVPAEGLRAGQHLYLFHIVDPVTGEAEEIEVAYDTETALLTAELEHFSEYEIGAVGEGWKPILTPPATDLFSGSATYNHPIQVPDGRGGVQPGLSISYNSRRVDGLIDGSGGEVEGGPVGLGWSLGGIPEITRHSKLKGSGTYQLDDNFSLVLNGTSHDLKAATGGSCGRYWAKDGPGVYVERRNNSCGTGSPSNETTDYWIVHTADGTKYQLGYTVTSEVSVRQGGNRLSCVGTWCSADPDTLGAIRWRVDTVTDVFGNQMTFTYREKTVEPGEDVEVQRSGVEEIRYNNYGSGQWLSEVQFVYDANDPDDDEYLRLEEIEVYQAGEMLREYKFIVDGKGWSVCDYSYSERTLRRIDEFSGDGKALPSVIFEYQEYNNTPGCFPFYRMSGMTNPYGGRVEFDYVSDGRWVTGSPVPEYGFSYRVSELRTYDLVHSEPARVTYAYGTPCYDQTLNEPWGEKGLRCKMSDYVGEVGSLAGHDWVTATVKAYDGAVVNKNAHGYYIADDDRWKIGREHEAQVYSAGGVMLQKARTDWEKVYTGGTTFAYMKMTRSWDYIGEDVVSTKTTYAYSPTLQAGAQYGNLTHVREYADADATTPYRTTVTSYTINSSTSVWIVNKSQETKVFAGDEIGTLLSHSRSYYDNSEDVGTAPITGTLTMAKQIDVAASEEIETRYEYDDWGNVIKARDPLDNEAEIEYDTVYHMYPLTATNALDHQRYVEYYGIDGVPADTGLFGQVKRVWDSNGTATATSYTYDTFGRLATVVRPGDTSGLPTTAYWYDETTAPDRVVVEYFSSNWLDTMYNTAENSHFEHWSYTYKSTPFRVRATQEPGTTPLHRLFCDAGDDCVDGSNDTRKHDTLYTTGSYGGWTADEWQYQGVLGYIWTSSGAGREPLYRCADVGANKLDYYLLVGEGTCSYQSLLGYVEPANAPIRVGVSQREVSGQAGTLDGFAYYDGWGREIQTRGEAEGGQWTVSSTEYDALGRAIKGYLPQFKSSSLYSAPDGLHTLTSYDALGRVSTVTAPDGTQTHHYYGIDNNGSVIPEPTGLWLHSTVDGNGHAKSFVQDAFGRLVVAREFEGTTAPYTLYSETTYEYDALDHLTQVTDAADGPSGSSVTTMEYDGLGRKEAMDDPDMGYWEYRYDDAGNLRKQLDARGQAICFYYDELHRLEGKTYHENVTNIDTLSCEGSYDVTYTYDESGHDYSIGRRTGVSDSSGTTAWTYDERGRVVTETKTIDGAGTPFVTQYVYDTMDRMEKMIYPDGEVVTHDYNDGGALESLIGDDSYVTDIDYNPMGQITDMALGNGLTTEYTYDPLNFRLERLQVGSLQDLHYVYDPVGNVTSILDGVMGETQHFEYDALDRLTSAESDVVGEMGFIDDALTHVTYTVTLSRSYANPVVFALPPSRDGEASSVVRITDVQADRFTLYVDEAPNLDGAHTDESVSYIVLEAGSWTLADGTRLEVGTLDTAATIGYNVSGSSWAHVDFDQSFTASPAVLSQVQTENDSHWVKTRQHNVATSGFDVAMEEEEAKTTVHGAVETIGWLAIEPGTGTWNGHEYEVGQTADAVTHAWYTISFTQSFSQAPRFVASLATYDGNDKCHLRYGRTSLTASGVQVMVEEDTTYDSEMEHVTEVVHYLAIEGSGGLTASGTEPGGPVSYARDYTYDSVGNILHKDGMGDYFYGDPDHVHAVTHVDRDQATLPEGAVFHAPFNGDADDVVGGAEATTSGGVIYTDGKFSQGVQVAEATTNWCTNPSAEINSTGWSFNNWGSSGGSVSRVTTDAYIGSASVQYEITNHVDNSKSVIFPHAITSPGGKTVTLSMWVKEVSNGGSATYMLSIQGNVSGNTTKPITLTPGEWTHVSQTKTMDPSDSTLTLRFYTNNDEAAVLIDAVQVEEKPYPTPYADGSLGDGHSWSGTEHNSTSSRTVATLRYDNPLDMDEGAVAVWMYYEDLDHAPVQGHWAFADSTGNAYFDVVVSSVVTNGRCMFRTSGDTNIYAEGYMAEGQWHQVIATWSVSAGEKKLYIDGVLRGTQSYSAGKAPGAYLRVGTNYSGGNTTQANGVLDDLAIFDRALSPEEIAQLHDQGAGNHYTYDANGNMTTRVSSGITYTQEFNAENKLAVVTNTVSGEVTTFTYDGDGNRVKKVGPSGTTYYVGGIYEKQVVGAGGDIQVTITGAEASVNQSGYHISESYNGIEMGSGDGWAYSAIVPASGVYKFSSQAVNKIVVVSGIDRSDHNPNDYYLYYTTDANPTIGGNWTPLAGLHFLNSVAGGSISGNHVTCNGQDEVQLGFNPVNATGIKIVIYGSNASNENSVLTEFKIYASESVTKYYYAGSQRVAMRQDDMVYYLHGDHLGSTSLTTDAAGDVVARVLYYPYGETRWMTGTLTTDYGFTGQRKDRTIKLLDYHARRYDPALGRFLSSDTIVPDPTNPQSLNRYAYVGNNPILYTDPSGHTRRPQIPGPPTPAQPSDPCLLHQAFCVGWDWLTEQGPGSSQDDPREFDETDQMTQDLMGDEGVNAARAEFYENGGEQVDWTGPDGEPDGIPDPYPHLVGLKGYTREFIIQNSWTGTYIGSYMVTIVNNGDGTATFIINNTSGWESATHIPFSNYENPTFEEVVSRVKSGDLTVFSYWPSISDPEFLPSSATDAIWKFVPTALLENRTRSEPGLGGNMYQRYTWTEPIPNDVLEGN